MIRMETRGITSFVEALQASMSETVDHTPPLSRVNVRCQLTRVNLDGSKRETWQFTGGSRPVIIPAWLAICPSIPHTQGRFEGENWEGDRPVRALKYGGIREQMPS